MLPVEEVVNIDFFDSEEKHGPTLDYETTNLTQPEMKVDLSVTNVVATQNLTGITLSDQYSITDAIDMISAVKEDNLSEKDKDSLIKAIGGKTVSCLKLMTQEECNTVTNGLLSDELKQYWACLLGQSCPLTPNEVLECEFNFGLKLHLRTEDETMVEEIKKMGFQEEIVMEAWTVTTGKDLEKMMNYALSPLSERYRQRYQAKQKLKRFVSPQRHWTVVENHLRSKSTHDPKTKTMTQLQEEILAVTKTLNESKQIQKKLQQEIDVTKHKNDLELFRHYLQGLIAGHRLSNQKASRLPIERQCRQVSTEEYMDILSQMNEDEKSMDAKRTENNSTKGNHLSWSSNVCIVCLDKSHGICDRLFVPCNHCVICSPCYFQHYQPLLFDTTSSDGVVCPICRKRAVEIRKVFF